MDFCVNLLHYYLVIFKPIAFWVFLSIFDHIKCITILMVRYDAIIDAITVEIGGIRFYYLPYLP